MYDHICEYIEEMQTGVLDILNTIQQLLAKCIQHQHSRRRRRLGIEIR